MTISSFFVPLNFVSSPSLLLLFFWPICPHLFTMFLLRQTAHCQRGEKVLAGSEPALLKHTWAQQLHPHNKQHIIHTLSVFFWILLLSRCSVIWCHSSALCYDPILSLKKGNSIKLILIYRYWWEMAAKCVSTHWKLDQMQICSGHLQPRFWFYATS